MRTKHRIFCLNFVLFYVITSLPNPFVKNQKKNHVVYDTFTTSLCSDIYNNENYSWLIKYNIMMMMMCWF